MVNFKTFQFSCDLMWGYRVNIDLDDCRSNDDIVDYGVSLLKSFLDSNNLEVLLMKINELNYHIHEQFEDIVSRNTDDNNIHGYICSHD